MFSSSRFENGTNSLQQVGRKSARSCFGSERRSPEIVHKEANGFENRMTANDAIHAATAEARCHPMLPSDHAHNVVDPERLPFQSDSD